MKRDNICNIITGLCHGLLSLACEPILPTLWMVIIMTGILERRAITFNNYAKSGLIKRSRSFLQQLCIVTRPTKHAILITSPVIHHIIPFYLFTYILFWCSFKPTPTSLMPVPCDKQKIHHLKKNCLVYSHICDDNLMRFDRKAEQTTYKKHDRYGFVPSGRGIKRNIMIVVLL